MLMHLMHKCAWQELPRGRELLPLGRQAVTCRFSFWGILKTLRVASSATVAKMSLVGCTSIAESRRLWANSSTSGCRESWTG